MRRSTIFFEISATPRHIALRHFHHAVETHCAQIAHITVAQVTIDMEHRELGTVSGPESTTIALGGFAITRALPQRFLLGQSSAAPYATAAQAPIIHTIAAMAIHGSGHALAGFTQGSHLVFMGPGLT